MSVSEEKGGYEETTGKLAHEGFHSLLVSDYLEPFVLNLREQ